MGRRPERKGLRSEMPLAERSLPAKAPALPAASRVASFSRDGQPVRQSRPCMLGTSSPAAPRWCETSTSRPICLGIEYDFIYSFTPYAGKEFFSGTDKTTVTSFGCPDRYSNSELWVTDGTTVGTKKLREIYPGVGGSIGAEFHYRGSDPQMLTVGGNRPAAAAKFNQNATQLQ
jgi:ELWxxDGT repeat protein